MTETKSKFSLDTAIGCKRVLAVLVSVAILLSFFAQLISTDMGRIKVEKIKIDVVSYTHLEMGSIMTMPGLPKKPAAEAIDVDENGVISGLF